VGRGFPTLDPLLGRPAPVVEAAGVRFGPVSVVTMKPTGRNTSPQ
jgi:hypothetical protein